MLDCVEAETVLSKARELEGELFENYRRFVKPRDNQTHPVDVKYSAVVQQLVDVEVETQRVTLGMTKRVVDGLFEFIFA